MDIKGVNGEKQEKINEQLQVQYCELTEGKYMLYVGKQIAQQNLIDNQNHLFYFYVIQSNNRLVFPLSPPFQLSISSLFFRIRSIPSKFPIPNLIFNWWMSFQNENIGMMDEGYFVSRNDILKWLNDLLQLNLTKIEQLGSGAVYCQVVDVVHPGKMTMAKVNWKARSEYEFINNFRLLQDSFNKIGIKRHIDCEKLAKAKYQDNLEFAQWFKRYYDLNCGDRGNNYLAEERRGGINPNFGFAEKNVVPKTYNGTGVIVPKKQSPPKKVLVVQQPPPKKVTTATTSTRPPKEVERRVEKKQTTPVNISKEDKQPQQKANGKREKQLQARLKDMEDKLLMITEILSSEEASELKVHMIAEVVNVHLKQEDSAQQTHHYEYQKHEHHEQPEEAYEGLE